MTEPVALSPHATTNVDELLGPALHAETVRYAVAMADVEESYARRQVTECLRYLYLVSTYPDQLGGLFLPVEQEIDEIWHYLILQTREYRELCARLPGGTFINHRSIAYEDYNRQPTRERMIEESLRWLPLYRDEFGPFDEGALPHWTMVRFLHSEMGMSLPDIATLEPTAVS